MLNLCYFHTLDLEFKELSYIFLYFLSQCPSDKGHLQKKGRTNVVLSISTLVPVNMGVSIFSKNLTF